MIRDLISILFLIMLFVVITGIVFFAVSLYLRYSMVRNRLNAIRIERVGDSDIMLTSAGLRAQKIFYWIIEFSMPKEKIKTAINASRLSR